MPKTTFSMIQSAIEQTPLSAGLNWFRAFYCQVGTQQVFEALMNNEPWPQGESALKGSPLAAG